MMRFVFIPISILLICSCFQRLPEISFREYTEQVNKLEQTGEYDEALALSYHILNKYPENEFTIIKEIIYINEKTGHYDENIGLWKNAHEKGYFFFIHPALPRYKPYLDIIDFTDIASRDMAMRDSANSASKCTYRILTEEHLDDKERPLILIFHGGGSSINKAITHWVLPEKLMYEYEVAFVQSYRHNDFNTYGWGIGDSIVYTGIVDVFNEICSVRNINTGCIYAMGISAGASAAMDIAANGIIDIKGIYAICPAMSVNFLVKHIRGLHDINIAIVCGENDQMIDRQNEMFGVLKDNSINAMFTVVKDMGHEFPPNQEEYLNDAFNFIRGE